MTKTLVATPDPDDPIVPNVGYCTQPLVITGFTQMVNTTTTTGQPTIIITTWANG